MSNNTFFAPRIVVGFGAVALVSPKARGTRIQVDYVAGSRDLYTILAKRVIDLMTNPEIENVNILGEVEGRKPFNDAVLFLGFRDDVENRQSIGWNNVMREIGRGAAIATETSHARLEDWIPAKAIMSYKVIGGMPQDIFNENEEVAQVALLSKKDGRMRTMIVPCVDGKYSVCNGVEKELLDLLPDVEIDGVKYPLSAEVLAHLLTEGYLIVAPQRAKSLIMAQVRLAHAALTSDFQAWEIVREEYRQRRVVREQARGTFTVTLPASALA